MSSSTPKEVGKRRLPAPPPPPIISGRRSTSRSSCSADVYQSNKNAPNPSTPDPRPSSYIKNENPTAVYPVENSSLFERRPSKSPVSVHPPPQQVIRAILNADEVIMPRRPDESKKPIFDRREIRESSSIIANMQETFCNDENTEIVNVMPLQLPSAAPFQIVAPEMPVIDKTDLRFKLWQKQLSSNSSFVPDNISSIQNQVSIDMNEKESDFKIESESKNSRSVVVSSSPPYSCKRMVIEDGEIADVEKYEKRRDRREKNKRKEERSSRRDDSIRQIQNKSIRKRILHGSMDKSGKNLNVYSQSEYANSDSENDTNSTDLDFKTMTLDWAAEAPNEIPSERISFLRAFLDRCTNQELIWAKNWAINISNNRIAKVRKEKRRQLFDQ